MVPEERRGKPAGVIDRTRVDALCAEFAKLPVLDPRPADDILGYDAYGIPMDPGEMPPTQPPTSLVRWLIRI